jgi:hypothetical protein
MAKKKISEAPIDYGDYPERPSRGIEDRISRGETIFKGNPAIPRTPEGTPYEEKLAGPRFLEVVDMARRFTGRQDVSSQQLMMMLAREMMTAVSTVTRIESEHVAELQKFTVDIIKKEYGLDDCSYIYDAQLISYGSISPEEFRIKPKQDDEDAEDEMPSFELSSEDLEIEKHKRQIINALVQGSAKKLHWIILRPDVKQYLDAINPQLQPLYAKIMAINDLFYWTMDDMIEAMSSTGQSAGGLADANATEEDEVREWVENETYGRNDIVSYESEMFISKNEVQSNINPEEDENNWCPLPPVTLKARGAFFAILVHELGKAVEMALAKFGLPLDPVTAEKVMSQTDAMIYEPDQLRLGPKMYERLRMLLPDELFAEDAGDLQNWFKMYFYQKPAQEFLELMRNVLSDNQRDNQKAEKEFEYLLKQAKSAREGLDDDDEDYEDDNDEDYPSPPNDDGFEDLDDFLKNMGIGPSK